MPHDKKYWKKRLGNIEMEAYQEHLDLRRIDDLNDEGLAYYLAHLKGVHMLDLNETEITNASIALVTRLEYVTELRIKGCSDIDDGCIADLNKITSLQFLHAKDTGITIDGLLQLDQLEKLEKLLFSADDMESIQHKMILLRNLLPGCDFVVNSIPYLFNNEI
jgi:hypothetical protein